MITPTMVVRDFGVQSSLKALAARFGNAEPVLQTIGEGFIERTKRRFDTSTDPDGNPWTPNSAATLAMLSARLAGKGSYRKKNGDLNAKGNLALANKKPLIGESGDLSRQFVQIVSNNTLTVISTPVYAAMQNFGGVTSPSSMIPGKVIPARTFFPVRQDGTLYPAEQSAVLKELNDYLAGDL